MTDRRSKKLKHDKINYESDRCYMSLRQFETNMRTLLESVVKSCSTCQKDRPKQARPKMKETLPSDALMPMN